jgi:hypothetical protein
MFGLSSISWGSFMLATALLCLLFNAGVWAYFHFRSQNTHTKVHQSRQQKFNQSLPF